MQITNHASSTHRSQLKANRSDQSSKITDVSAGDAQQSSIAQLNSRIQAIEEHPTLRDKAALNDLKDQRGEAISQLTGNSDASSYDPELAAIAERDGITYTTAVDNRNRTTAAFHPPAVENPALTNHVSRVPWENPVVNARVSELMSTEGLSRDAAVVLAMTERPTTTSGNSIDTTFASDWQAQLSLIAGRAGPEIEAWAVAQEGVGVSSVTGTAVDDDISVTLESGMVVVRILNPSTGRERRVERFDPATSDRIIISAGGGNDVITVDEAVTSQLLIAGGNGQDFIYGGGGSEIILGGSGVDLIRGNAGNDIIIGGDGADNIEGGDGNDLVQGGSGDDVASGDGGSDLLWGGTGEDSIYGGDGEDLLLGEAGFDYIDGGQSSDHLDGGDADDVLSGGKGDDVLVGGAGNDRLIGASGRDSYSDASAGDLIIAESSDVLASAGASVQIIEVNSTAGSSAVSIDARARTDFRSRVEDDLETLRSTASGQAMLNALDQRFHETERTEGRPSEYRRGHSVGITELDARDEIAHIRDPGRNDTTENGYANTGADWQRNPAQLNSRLGDSSRHARLRPAPGGSAVISYNPSVNLQLHTARSTPPIVILFHEFAHSYNMVTGTGVSGIYNGPETGSGVTRNRERQATGLTLDHDGRASTPDQLAANHPLALTENGIRAELGLPQRPYY